MHLEAIKPILYASTQFQPGDMLPADNVLLADAWVKSGAAAWIGEKENEKNASTRRSAAKTETREKAAGDEEKKEPPKNTTRKKKDNEPVQAADRK